MPPQRADLTNTIEILLNTQKPSKNQSKWRISHGGWRSPIQFNKWMKNQFRIEIENEWINEWIQFQIETGNSRKTRPCLSGLDFSTIWSHSQPVTSTLQCNSALRAEGTGRLAWAALRNMKNLPYFMGKQSKHRLIYGKLLGTIESYGLAALES